MANSAACPGCNRGARAFARRSARWQHPREDGDIASGICHHRSVTGPWLANHLTGTRERTFEWFKEHVTTSLLSLQRHLASMSLQKHLGPRLFSAIRRIVRRGGDEVCGHAAANRTRRGRSVQATGSRIRETFIARQFARPGPLGLLRWEEIANPAEAVELFEPYRPLFRRIRTFGNSLWLSARGALGSQPIWRRLRTFLGATARTVEPNEILGVLFSCRQGEFKQFGDELVTS